MSAKSTNEVSIEHADPVADFLKSFHGQWRLLDALSSTYDILVFAGFFFIAKFLIDSDVLWNISIGLTGLWVIVFFMCAAANRLGPPYWSDPRVFSRHDSLLNRYINKTANR
jgi:hypothetical protein